MKYLPIILARTGSSRMPRKVLADLCGKPVLVRIVERIKRVAQIENVVIATSNVIPDDQIENLCRKYSIPYFRGDLENVLDRVIQCSQITDIEHDYVIEITGDCPLVCPEIIKDLISKCEMMKPDYLSNVAVRSYCDGFDVQLVKKEVLYEVYNKVPEYHRCHGVWNVLAYADGIRIYNKVPLRKDMWMPEVGLTLDTPMDYEVILKIYEHFADCNYVFNHYDVYALIQDKPEILDINKNVKRKAPGKDD